ncbi:MAG: alanine racemase [Cytophagales bacterium]|nr:alanine racemase [Cytophagales bacterium]
MQHTSHLEISRAAVHHNLAYIQKQAGSKVIISSVVKGNAYGHGIEPFARLALEVGIRHFSVFSAQEAQRVKSVVGPDTTILIMGFVADEDLPWVLENEVEVFVFEFDRLHHLLAEAERLDKAALLHVEIETGMNRTGFDEREFDALIQLLLHHQKHLRLKALCTHLAGAEHLANHLRVQSQIRKYHHACDVFAQAGLQPLLKHVACSAAFINYPETHFDLLRIGILQYGFWPSQETYVLQMQVKRSFSKDPLKRALSWKSRVMAIKEVKAGEYVSYGTSYLASRKLRIAIVPCDAGIMHPPEQSP